MERSCTVNLVTLKTNTFMERSSNVNLLTQLKTKRGALSWKVSVAL